MRQIHVKASREYEVLIGSGLLEEAGARIGQALRSRRAVIAAGETVAALYGGRLMDSLRSCGFEVSLWTHPSGEAHKTLESYASLLRFLCRAQLGRGDTLIALGGGVTGDLAGFAAATYQRGMNYIQVPTSLLAMVDSSVGGKTAVDLPEGKNQVGCFYQPSLVLCDYSTLATLPEEQFLCGSAEVIKYGVLGDEVFFESLQRIPIRDQLETVIAACVEKKRDFVAEDEYDRGRRQLLNLGHSIGHAIESCSGYRILHGQAVAIGMSMMTLAAQRQGICASGTSRRLDECLERYGLPRRSDFSADELLNAMLSDKKRSGSSMNLIVPEAIGRCRIEKVPITELKHWLLLGGAT